MNNLIDSFFTNLLFGNDKGSIDKMDELKKNHIFYSLYCEIISNIAELENIARENEKMVELRSKSWSERIRIYNESLAKICDTPFLSQNTHKKCRIEEEEKAKRMLENSRKALDDFNKKY